MGLFSSDKTSGIDGHINVIAEFTAKPEHAAEVRAMFMALVEPARAEDGCKDYHLLAGKKDPNSFYTYESWTGEDKLNKHLDGLKPELEKLRPMLTQEPKITVLNHLV